MRWQYQGVRIASVTAEIDLVSTKDARNALKGQHGFVLHMVEAVAVLSQGVTRVLETNFIVRLMVVESAVSLRGVTSRLLVALASVLPMEAVADVP
jgi:hypothetical protein